MSASTSEIFVVFNISTGAPLTGAAGGMSFDCFKDETGSNLSQPSITEIGGGFYQFVPTFASQNRGIAYILNTGTGGNPVRLSRFIRPQDFAADNCIEILTDTRSILQFESARCKIFVTGPDANRCVVYEADGTTVKLKFDLKDSTGAPTFTAPFERVPV